MFFNTSEPLTVVLLLTATVLLIFLGKEIKKPIAPAIALALFLGLLILHTVQLTIQSYEAYYTAIRYSIAYELVMVLLTFLSYLWVDDIACKYYNKKSIDNSLDWFWKQI